MNIFICGRLFYVTSSLLELRVFEHVDCLLLLKSESLTTSISISIYRVFQHSLPFIKILDFQTQSVRLEVFRHASSSLLPLCSGLAIARYTQD
jgi:hypothetical protein